MKAVILKLSFVMAGVCLLCSCGGGGGSGKSSSTGVRVLHGAIDEAPIDVAVTGELPLGTFHFAIVDPYVSLDEGPHELVLSARQRPEEIFSRFTFDFHRGEKWSVLVFGGNGNVPLQFALQNDTAQLASLGDFAEGKGALRVAHAAFGAAGVRVFINGSPVGEEIAYGHYSNFLPVGSAAPVLEVQRASDGKLLARTTVAMQSGGTATVLIAGEVDLLVTATTFSD